MSRSRVLGYLRLLGSRLLTGHFAPKTPIPEPPLRSEILSADQMERAGKTLASAHRLTPHKTREQLLLRLAANETVLIDVCRRLTASVSASHRVSPAGEWLLDNFHLIAEQIATARRHFPRGYSQELPRLALGPSAGAPRVYDIALETVSHGDGRVDADSLTRFVAAYQSVTPLKLGELWAIPIMLRLALIENLRRVGARVALGKDERDLANGWADLMMQTAERDPKSLILVIADMARSNPPMESAFVAELVRRLQGHSAPLALALTWIEQRLAESHLTIEQLVQIENQRQASDQVSISNSIGGLRVLSAIDWRDFVETLSLVEDVLRDDPAGVYAAMAFATRDHYRHATERIAKAGRFTEPEVATKAIELARASAFARGTQDRTAHVGYFLIDAGVPQLEHAAGAADSIFGVLPRIGKRFPLAVYLAPIGLITALFTAGLAAHAHRAGAGEQMVVLVAALALVASSQLAVTIVNWLATLWVKPHSLPRMDFSAGIAEHARTLVVVPTMISSARNVEDLVEALEVRFLANRDPCLHFGLLSDFLDASEESLPDDAALLRSAQVRIQELNDKYGGGFHLFHRPRCWNPESGVWMGHERKRGKLADLNALLRGGDASAFSLVVGETDILAQIKYVITLDTDTQLPRDAAREFVAAMAHPMNIPSFDEAGKHTGHRLVTSGHGILQPRVSASLPATNRSRYARLYGGEPGIDPYTRTVSDVYQDVFDEGSFIGKGIYDVDAFETALRGRFPLNRILSHDLLEGCYARSGLLSDVELYEEFPARYGADVARRRRWIRGDWQLAGWLRRRVKGPDGRRERNPLSMLSQWKIFDNLRRSLVPIALTALLVLGWAALSPTWFWTAMVLGILLIPSVIGLFSDLADKPAELPLTPHLAAVTRTARRHLAQALLALTFLPYEAFVCLDAVVRTLGRTMITHRRLLEWVPSSAVEPILEQRDRASLLASYRSMAIAPATAAAAFVGLCVADPMALVTAGPILLLWAISPAVAWWLSRPLQRRSVALTNEQTQFLRALARKTWAYFETYVGPDDQWLPPDNVQDHPAVTIAHRTSPTNMGLALLANLTAHDFGYLSIGQLLTRTTDALNAMESLERFRGHFYNWYDTRTRAPMEPLYVSTVDSGNLAGHLLTLRPGLAALCDAPILNARWLEGLRDTFSILQEAIAEDTRVAAFDAALTSAAAAGPATLPTAWDALQTLATLAKAIVAGLPATTTDDGSDETGIWAAALARQCAAMRDELVMFAPWLGQSPTSHTNFPGAKTIPTLRELSAFAAPGQPTGDPGRVNGATSETTPLPDATRTLLAESADRAAAAMDAIHQLVLRTGTHAAMDYGFLFDNVRRQLVIGYNVTEHRRDDGCYDLLASEARLCNFVAIAQGQLPKESWFALGRQLTSVGGSPALLAWSGSMFEYLMPLLVMPTYEDTLLDQTYAAAVERQIEYGRQRGVPWGMSESGYNAVDVQLNYQYRAFGVPGLGLKRGLGNDLVVAPYASALALMVAPEAACLNLQRLSAAGLAGRLGLFEAIDFTPSRVRRGESSAVVRSFMAHHQAMSLLAYAYLLLGRPMQKRFESDAMLQATLPLLQERIPRITPFHSDTREFDDIRTTAIGPELQMRMLTNPDTPTPEVQLLSNGRYHVMVTNAGGGYSRWKDLAVTRWREDSTRDNWGTFCYLRDEASGEFWSTAYQPTLQASRTLRSDLLRRPRGVSAPGFRLRDAYRDRGIARR